MEERFYNLDLLKVVAAVFIVFHHYQQYFCVSFEKINFFGGSFYWGYLVELFFMISGFVTAVSDRRKGQRVIQKFIGKCIRIYPSSILACTACIIILFTGHLILGEYIDTSIDYTDSLTVISSYLLIFCGWFLNIGLGINNPTWYLCVLLLCYIIYYIVELILVNIYFERNILYFIIFLVSFGGLCFGKYLPWFFTYQNLRGYTCFFEGILLYNLMVKRLMNKQIWLSILGLAILTVIGARYLGIESWGVLVLFFYPLLILVSVTIKQLPGYVARYPGGVSFQMYLWHVPCFMLLKLIVKVSGIQITHTYFTMILVALFVELVAMVVYQYYEIPVTRWLKKKSGV